MNESEYYQLTDGAFAQIENALDTLDAGFDFEISSGMLNLEFENGVKIILSRQTPLSQLWLATPKGAYHFNYDAAKRTWLEERTNEDMLDILSRHCSEQSGTAVRLKTD